MISTLHLSAGVIALALGLLVVLSTKGTKRHKTLGYAYTLAMVILNLTSFGIYGLFDGWGAFHYMALFSLATLLAGLIPAWGPRQEKSWIVWHNKMMSYSYVGLVMATGSHIMGSTIKVGMGWGLAKVEAQVFAILLGWCLPLAVGMILIERYNRRHFHHQSHRNK